jgi:hypothetical protein
MCASCSRPYEQEQECVRSAHATCAHASTRASIAFRSGMTAAAALVVLAGLEVDCTGLCFNWQPCCCCSNRSPARDVYGQTHTASFHWTKLHLTQNEKMRKSDPPTQPRWARAAGRPST